MAKFTNSELEDFLTQGWIYALDDNHFCVGWESSEMPSATMESFRFLCPEFFFEAANENEWIPAGQATVERDSLEDALQSYLQGRSVSSPLSWKATRDAFVEQFAALQSLIARGLVSKGVPYGQVQTSTLVDPPWIARRLLTALREGTAARLYGFWNNEQGLIGCSPELLCEYAADTNLLTTQAVAGTIPLHDYEPGALLHDDKAVREHTLVVDDLAERLSDLGIVKVGQTSEYPVPGLVHLKASLQVEVEQKEISMMEVVQRLHPTAALGVYPRNETGRAWLREADRQLARWRFGAPFGVNHRSSESKGFSCLVAIRNVQWQGRDVRISAGCGVIASSQLECEWEECLAKIQSIRNLLDL